MHDGAGEEWFMRDSFEREIDYMRISVTDRCNLRCSYCMPREGIELAPAGEILTFEEIVRVCQAAAELGIRKLKITGGEPLVRPDCHKLVGMLKRLPGVSQVTLTTNGILLGRYLDRLLENGLDAVNISLDTLDEEVYRQITGFDELPAVRAAMTEAVEKGLRVKINSVLQRGVNDREWMSLAELARETPTDVRFIEMMPIGLGKQQKGVSGKKVLFNLKRKYPGIKPDDTIHGNGPAVYYRIPGFAGSIGFISAVHGRFCESCNRIRLTAKGELKPCLCYETSVDVKKALRSPVHADWEEEREELKNIIRQVVGQKPERHCFEAEDRITEGRQMVQIGG